ncbi:EAL domain-containing protein [Paenibacillus zeisoli]|uniref:EAL domain-containing protein n=1 Tax=Paenibacillus zeisoli TaxID=2496267 RepID=A0A433XC65_9BACL|nr:EAL domain-containing protein [Paenibacillus zeisoli]RUT31673.1 EAL domain-containing protein [Paenibacillus zeisoli]
MICSSCGVGRPIEDNGVISLRPITSEFISLLTQEGFQVICDNHICSVAYHSRAEILELIQCIRKTAWADESEMYMNIEGVKSLPDRPVWVSLAQMEARFHHHGIVDIIVEERFTSYMQPIVSHREEVVGFEFLMRPSSAQYPFNPFELFEIARETGLHSFLDRAARISAIEISALHLPRGFKRFINFLPSSIYNPQYCLTHTFEAIERHSLDPKDFVFEVVETEQIHNMNNLVDIFDEYRKNGISVALDDVGSGYSTLAEMSRLKPDYVKIDRSLVDGSSRDKRKQQEILNIIERAKDFGGYVLAEGIEEREDFEFCRAHGAAFAQGYLFGKPMPEPPQGLTQ